MKRYIKTRAEAEAIGGHIATREIGEYGFAIEILTQTRTLKQNSAIHKYFALLSTALNDSGAEIEMKFLGKTMSVPWTPDLVKERIWKGAMLAATGKTSTTKMTRAEVSEVYEILSRFFTEGFGIYVPFPEQERG